jgi:hypothetical protein
MFVAEEECLDVGFGAVQARLANLLHGGALITSSADCYEQGMTGLARVGPLGSAPGRSKLVDVQFGGMVLRGDSARLPLRRHATGPGGGLFPALDADLELTALSEDATMLRLAGAYRPPLGKRRRAGPGRLAAGGRSEDPGLYPARSRCHRSPGPRSWALTGRP